MVYLIQFHHYQCECVVDKCLIGSLPPFCFALVSCVCFYGTHKLTSVLDASEKGDLLLPTLSVYFCSFHCAGSRATPAWNSHFRTQIKAFCRCRSPSWEHGRGQECNGRRRVTTTFVSGSPLELYCKTILFKGLTSMPNCLSRLAFRNLNSLNSEMGMCFLCEMLIECFGSEVPTDSLCMTLKSCRSCWERHAQLVTVCITLELWHLTNRLQISICNKLKSQGL